MTQDILLSIRSFLSTQQENGKDVSHAVETLEVGEPSLINEEAWHVDRESVMVVQSSLKQATATLMEEYREVFQRYSEGLSLQVSQRQSRIGKVGMSDECVALWLPQSSCSMLSSNTETIYSLLRNTISKRQPTCSRQSWWHQCKT